MRVESATFGRDPIDEPASAISGAVVPHLSVHPEHRDLPVRRTFRDAGLQARFDDVGFAVVPFLDSAALDAVRAIWHRVGPAPGDERDGFFPGNASHSTAWKREVIAAVEPVVADVLSDLLDRHHAFHLTFMTKWPGPNGRLQTHQDSTMVDQEGRYRGLNVWCPLNAPTEADQHAKGALRIVPGSHRLVTATWYRARGGFIPSGLEDVEQEIFDHWARPVPVAQGEAIAFDHRLIHCSSPNSTGEPLVLAIGLRPEEVGNVHVECDADGWVDFYAVDDDYFIAHPFVDMSDYRHLRRLHRDPSPRVTVADLAAVAGPIGSREPAEPEEASGNFSGNFSDNASAGGDAVVVGRAALPKRLIGAARYAVTSALARGRVPVLADPVLDRRLRRDGFVRVPLLDRDTAAGLRERYGELHGWEGSGFEVDFWAPDPTYRRATSDAIAGATDDALRQLFVGHSPFLRNFLVKWSDDRDDREFPKAPHRDWMYTDEQAGVKSWVVWIALEDIEGDNGQLQVARGSHRLDRDLRGSNIFAEWLDFDDVWDRRMSTTPTRAGEAIVLDCAVVHRSYPNFSGRPRVAVAVALKPDDAELVHFGRADDHDALRYVVDTDFFLNQRVDELMNGQCAYPVSGRVPIGDQTMSRVDLAWRLDRQPLAVLDRIEAAGRQVVNRFAPRAHHR